MQSVLIGTCDYCKGYVYENSVGTLSELWCESERLMLDGNDIVIPVPDAPEDLHDNDPEAYGEFVITTNPVEVFAGIRESYLELIGA